MVSTPKKPLDVEALTHDMARRWHVQTPALQPVARVNGITPPFIRRGKDVIDKAAA